jgi:LacI family transcriptional regulator
VPFEDSPAPTLASVAAAAGVSIATVSRVKNGRADVGPETRARVQTLLEQHDYVGRGAERASPALPDQQTVEVVFHGRLSVYCLEVLAGVLAAATRPGCPSRSASGRESDVVLGRNGPRPGFAT